MQNLTPDWLQVCQVIRQALVEAMENMDDSLDEGADPMYVAAETLSELKMSFQAIEADPSEVVNH